MSEATGAVIDATALLAYIQDEPGAEPVDAALAVRPVISSVNYAEVLSRLADDGQDPKAAYHRLQAQGLIGVLLTVQPANEDDAVAISRLRPLTRAQGLSLGDRACLAIGIRLGQPVLAADRAWGSVDVDVIGRLIRS